MEEYFKTPIKALPDYFLKEIHEQVRLYSTTMLMAEKFEDDDVMPCAGTLCCFKSSAGILTAKHVWQEAKKHTLLLVLTERGTIQLQTKEIVPLVPETEAIFPNTDAKIPDIAFLEIDIVTKRKIEAAGKVFYSIEKRVCQLPSYSDLSIGYWVIFGSPDALLRRDLHRVSSFIYGTDIEKRLEVGKWDYLTVNLNIHDNPEVPKDFSGVSGGGIWRVKWVYDTKDEIYKVLDISNDCTFSGVCFYQTAGNNSMLIAQGPGSIYGTLPRLFGF